MLHLYIENKKEVMEQTVKGIFDVDEIDVTNPEEYMSTLTAEDELISQRMDNKRQALKLQDEISVERSKLVQLNCSAEILKIYDRITLTVMIYIFNMGLNEIGQKKIHDDVDRSRNELVQLNCSQDALLIFDNMFIKIFRYISSHLSPQ